MIHHWQYVELRSVGRVVTGNTPSRSEPENYGGSVPWAKPPDLGTSKPILQTAEYLSDLGRSKARMVPPGAVLVGCIGRVGLVGIAGCELATNQQINSVVFGSSVIPKFGYYALVNLRQYLEAASGKAVVPILNKGDFEKIRIPVPHLREQARIVDVLDQADALRKQRAFADAKFARLLPTLFRCYFGNPLELANSPKARPLCDFRVDVRTGFACGDKSVEGGIPHMRMNNISDDGTLNLSLVRTIPTEKDRPELHLHAGDVLLMGTNSEEKVGKACLVIDNPDRPTLFSNHLYRLRVEDAKLNGEFLASYLHELWRTGYFVSIIRRWVNQAALPRERLLALSIPAVATDTITSYAAVLRQVRRLQSHTFTSSAKLETTFQTLLHHAFAGSLTAKWREAHLKEHVQEITRVARG